MATVDVIVLNCNGQHFLKPCLLALQKQSFRDFEMMVVDNGSTDGSVVLLQREFPEVRILELPENLGFCAGNNRGIEATWGRYVALLNNDTEAESGWLQALVEALENQPDVGFCASRMIRMSDRVTVDTAGDLFHVFGVGGKRGKGKPKDSYTEPGKVFGACAGAAIYRRAMLEEIGLFDEDFFATNEDIDLSFRARLHGYNCAYVPDAVVYHHVGGSFGNLSHLSDRLARRNMLEVVIKNMPAWLLLKYGPFIATYYAAGDIFYMLRRDPSVVLQARWENIRRLRRTLAKRRMIQRKRVVCLRRLEEVLTHQWPRFSTF